MKKKVFAGIAALAVVIGLGSYLFFHVEAQGILTGLEEKVTDKVSKKEKFQIVEIVPNGGAGEIGCLVNQADQDMVQEKMDDYLTGYLQEDASHQNTREVRLAYVEKLMGVYAFAIGDEGKPLTLTQGYEEAYFPEDTENWKTLEFSEENYEAARLKGVFEADGEGKGSYEMNIKQFDYTTGTGCYVVTFGTTMLSDKEEAIYHQPYHVREVDENNHQIMEVAGADETEGLYYVQSYEYRGTEDPEALYAAIPVAEKPYDYVGENGTYHFRLDDTMPETEVQIGRIYYQFGLENHDWFRSKVLTSKDSDNLEIETITIEERDLKEAESAEEIQNADFIYVCGDVGADGAEYQDKAGIWSAIGSAVTERKVPCMIDASTGVWENCGTYQEGYDGQAAFVKENVYICGDQKERQSFFAEFETKIEDVSGLAEVVEFVRSENLLRSGNEKLSPDLTPAFLLQYIIDYGRQREIGTKDSFRVLEIQPTDSTSKDTAGFELTEQSVAKWAGVSEDTAIEITSMSTAEFIGKADDLNKEYDLIYLGASIDYFNTSTVGGVKTTAFNDTRMNGLIYMHTGDYVAGNVSITGMMDVDYGGAYTFKDSLPRPYARNASNVLFGTTYLGYLLHNNGGGYTAIRSRTLYEDGILRQEFRKPYTQTQYQYGIGATAKELSGDLMIYRYSGNDITRTRLSDLLDYVGANYPVVISDALLNTAADGGKTVNEEAVDNTSYLYQFMDQIKNHENVFTVTQAEAADSKIASYLSLPKPKLLYFDPDTPEQLEEYAGVSTEAGNTFQDVSKMTIDHTNGTYMAKLGFYLDSTVDASLSSVYIPRFYLDLNADGKFLESGTNGSSEQMSCTIYNADTGEEAPKDGEGNYQLTSRVRYRLEREIPSTYLGVLTWKLELIQADNHSIRTSDIQYTKVDGEGEAEQVKVLQVTSTYGSSDNTTISLASGSKGYDNKLQEYLEEVQRTTKLEFQITTMGGDEFGNRYAASAQDYYDRYLEEYDMLIFGFADQYYDLSNTCYAVDAVNLFIDTGKSVLFSHDTTSFVNVSPNHSFKDGHITGTSDDLDIPRQWGYDMNCAFRNVLAMDRYGVTMDTDTTLSADMQNQGALLKQQQHLTVNTQTLEATVNQGYVCEYDAIGLGKYETGYRRKSLGYFLTRDISGAALSSNRDVAYAAKTYNSTNGTAQAYGQTHGFTNGLLNRFLVEDKDYLGEFENQTQKKNLRNDLLPNGNSNSTGIARAKVTSVNEGLITHYPYEIGQEFTSATTHFQYYQLNLDQDEDGDGEGDVVVWYCLSGAEGNSNADKVYSNNKNDARNNYYIYNIGNVTYTGMGHSALDHSGSDLEAKLFVNTIVAAYKAGVESPTIRILETSEKSSSEKKYEYVTYDDAAGSAALTEDVEFYFTISDPNLTTSQKTMTVEFTYYNGTEDIALDADQLEITDVTTGAPVTGNYTEGHVYRASLKDAAGKLAQTGNGSLEIKAKVNCSFEYYGRQESHDGVTSLTILRMSLFDLN